LLEYPIYKHLIQFSNLVDKNGLLMTDPGNGVSANLLANPAKVAGNGSGEAATDSKAVEEKKGDGEEENEGGEADLAYEGGGGDTQNT
jgi:hypothetical protein